MTEREYNECVNLYADNVYRFILKNLRHNEDAKDVVQGAFEKLWVNRAKVENERSKSYLFTIAYNQMIDHVRKNKRIVLREDFAENAKGAGEQKHDAKRILNEALYKLSEKQRSLVLLKDYEGNTKVANKKLQPKRKKLIFWFPALMPYPTSLASHSCTVYHY